MMIRYVVGYRFSVKVKLNASVNHRVIHSQRRICESVSLNQCDSQVIGEIFVVLIGSITKASPFSNTDLKHSACSL